MTKHNKSPIFVFVIKSLTKTLANIMLIQYAIDANFNEFVDAIERLDDSILNDGTLIHGRGCHVAYHIQDENFNAQANVTLQWQAAVGYVAITLVTAMSGFTYTIKPSVQEGVCIVTYEGAYNGFLSQNLLFKCLKPAVLDNNLLVMHSIGCCTLKEYRKIKGS